MSKILMIISQNGFRDEELFVPKEILEKEGHEVKIASITRMKAIGSKGSTVQPDMAVYEANAEFFDAIIVVGGPGSPSLSNEQNVINLLIKAAKNDIVIGGICLGPMSLAKAGVLAGKNATIWPDRSAINLLRQTAANYMTMPVVADGKIITADGPGSAGKFGASIANLLKG